MYLHEWFYFPSQFHNFSIETNFSLPIYLDRFAQSLQQNSWGRKSVRWVFTRRTDSVPRLPPPPPPPTHKRRHYYNTQSQGRLCIILTPIFPSITRVRTPKFDPKGLLTPISVNYLFSKRPSLRPKAENRVGFVGKSRPPFYSATASRGSSREVFCVPP